MAGPKKILIVDDEPDLIEIARDHLESAGYAVFSAGDGREGLKAAKQNVPDLILLDIQMPDIDGLEMLQLLRGMPGLAATPVLMVTARGRTENIFESQRLRAVDFLIKPFTCEELLDAVRKAF